MVELFLRALDRLIDLLRVAETRRTTRFNEIHKPTYEDLKLVHADYLAMFVELREILNEGRNDPTLSGDALSEARMFLASRRVAFEPVRDKLFLLFDMLGDSMWAPELTDREREFLTSVARYATTNQWALWAHHHGPISAATTLLGAIDAACRRERHFDIQLVHGVTTVVCRDLRQHWKEASAAYNKLRAEVLSSQTR